MSSSLQKKFDILDMLIVLARDEWFSFLKIIQRGDHWMIFLPFYFFTKCFPLNMIIPPHEINLHNWTQFGLVQVLHKPYQHSALTQLVGVVVVIIIVSVGFVLYFIHKVFLYISIYLSINFFKYCISINNIKEYFCV